jgi:hypothetical protein
MEQHRHTPLLNGSEWTDFELQQDGRPGVSSKKGCLLSSTFPSCKHIVDSGLLNRRPRPDGSGYHPARPAPCAASSSARGVARPTTAVAASKSAQRPSLPQGFTCCNVVADQTLRRIVALSKLNSQRPKPWRRLLCSSVDLFSKSSFELTQM